MEDAQKSQPPVITTHTMIGPNTMKVAQQMANMNIEAEYSVTENVKSQEDEDL